jgi:hypothetical protein
VGVPNHFAKSISYLVKENLSLSLLFVDWGVFGEYAGSIKIRGVTVAKRSIVSFMFT